jgi:hypothetical protein
MSQTSYPSVMGGLFAGLLDEEHPSRVVSAVNTEASAAISTGVFVKYDTNYEQVKNMAAAADMPYAIAIYRPGVERFGKGLGTGGNYYAPKERVDLLLQGRVWMRAEEALAITDTPIVRCVANGANTILGAVAKTTDGTNTRTFPGVGHPGFRIIKPNTVAGVGLVLVEFDSLMLNTVGAIS